MCPNPNALDDDQNSDEFDPNFLDGFFSGPDDEHEVEFPADISDTEFSKAMLRNIMPQGDYDFLSRFHETVAKMNEAGIEPDEEALFSSSIGEELKQVLQEGKEMFGGDYDAAGALDRLKMAVNMMFGGNLPSAESFQPDVTTPKSSETDESSTAGGRLPGVPPHIKDMLAQMRGEFPPAPDVSPGDETDLDDPQQWARVAAEIEKGLVELKKIMSGDEDVQVDSYRDGHERVIRSASDPTFNYRKMMNHYTRHMAQFVKDGYRMPDEDDLPSDDELNQFIKRKLVELEQLPHRTMYIVTMGMRIPWWRYLHIYVSYDEHHYQKVEASGQAELIRKELAAALVERFPVLESRIIDIMLSGE